MWHTVTAATAFCIVVGSALIPRGACSVLEVELLPCPLFQTHVPKGNVNAKEKQSSAAFSTLHAEYHFAARDKVAVNEAMVIANNHVQHIAQGNHICTQDKLRTLAHIRMVVDSVYQCPCRLDPKKLDPKEKRVNSHHTCRRIGPPKNVSAEEDLLRDTFKWFVGDSRMSADARAYMDTTLYRVCGQPLVTIGKEYGKGKKDDRERKADFGATCERLNATVVYTRQKTSYSFEVASKKAKELLYDHSHEHVAWNESRGCIGRQRRNTHKKKKGKHNPPAQKHISGCLFVDWESFWHPTAVILGTFVWNIIDRNPDIGNIADFSATDVEELQLKIFAGAVRLALPSATVVLRAPPPINELDSIEGRLASNTGLRFSMYTEYVAAMHRLASKRAIHFIDSGSLAMRYLAALEGGLGGNYKGFDSLLFKDN